LAGIASAAGGSTYFTEIGTEVTFFHALPPPSQTMGDL
jgi:hypothetical protein